MATPTARGLTTAGAPSVGDASRLCGRVFNIQKYSVQDGPGIRTTVFLKGCPLACVWCHNPESISRHPEVLLVDARCQSCGECARVCPTTPDRSPTASVPVGSDYCIRCGTCVDACPSDARRTAGRETTVKEVMTDVMRDRIFYEDSGGGVTFSGGEPLAQPEFLAGLLIAARAGGLHTAVDTSGFASPVHLLGIAPLTDLFLFDLKLMDDARHRRFTGVSNRLILDNLTALARIHGALWIRMPIIPGVNDADDDLVAAARFIATLAGVQRVSLLPYHATGVAKHRQLGHREAAAGLRFPEPDPSRLGRLEAILHDFALPVVIGR